MLIFIIMGKVLFMSFIYAVTAMNSGIGVEQRENNNHCANANLINLDLYFEHMHIRLRAKAQICALPCRAALQSLK
ncbi:hypothetical protein ACLK14_17590 [Escherichia coli]